MTDRLDHDLLVLLHDVARLLRTRADRQARQHALTRAQWMILARLHRHGGSTQRALAELLEVEPITVGRLVDRLEARGLVERRADPQDRRSWRLHLTPAAAPVLESIDAAHAALDAESTAGLPPPVREAMVAGLQAIKARLTGREPAAT